jgi:cyclohexanecarboxylate-CoA ligase
MSAPRPTHPSPLAATYRARGEWRPETLWHAFAGTAARHPERVALVDGAHRIAFSELARRAECLAGGLARLGIAAGDVVAAQLPNWWETAVVLLAAARLGAVANPVLPIARERELRYVLGASRARVAFIPGALRDCDHRGLVAALRPELPALEHVVTVRADPGGDMTAFATLAGSEPAATSPPADAAAIALLMYTSGTTADPKGVLHSHETLLAEARSLGPVHGITSADVVLMPSPLTHVSGLLHAVVLPAVHGTGAVLMERWDAGEALALIARERVTYMVGAPTFLRDLAHHPRLGDHDVSSLRLFSCGGADVDPTLVREAAARLGCVAKRVYGSTEFPTVATTGPDDPPERRVDSEGRPIGAAEIRLVDEEDRAVGAGVEGEVLARGPELFLGYHDPVLNAEAFTPDGWFRTGDLGTVDAAGYLRITGRKKDIIIRKGENISAREVEDLLAGHPAIAEVAVVGLPDEAAGEIACAAVRLRPNAASPTLAQLSDHLLAQGLSKRKLPERLEVVADFPRTSSGKILKRVLRETLAFR